MRPRAVRSIAIGCATLAFAAAIWRMHAGEAVAPDQHAAAERAAVRVAAVTRGPIELWQSSVGTVLPVNSVVLRPRVDGQIERVNFRDGQIVAPGLLLFEIDARPYRAQLQAARAQRDRDAALLANAELDFRRYDALLRSDSTPAQIRDTALALVHQFEGTVAYDDAQVALARLNLSYTSIRAPFGGRIGARLVDPGNLVRTTDAGGLAVIDQIEPIYVAFSLPQDRLAALRAAKPSGAAPVIAETADGGTVLDRGTLIFIDNRIDAATGTLRCRALFENARRDLWPGAFVNASVRLGSMPDAVTVPTRAVQSGPEGPFVYVVYADQIARRRPVRIAGVQGDRTLIAAGLTGGERVVTEGVFRLDAATPVSIRPD